MKKVDKKLVVLLVIFAVIFVAVWAVVIGLFAGGKFSVDEPKNDSGVAQKGYSNEVEWILYNDGELVLKGSGDMEDIDGEKEPEKIAWNEYGDSVKKVYIDSGVKSVSRGAFMNCKQLDRFTVSSRNKDYSNDDSGVLFNKTKTELVQYPIGSEIESYDIPDGVEDIKDLSFSNAENLKKVKIPNTVKKIGDKAFADCSNLEMPEIPDSVTDIAENAFGNEKDAFYRYIKENMTVMDTAKYPDDLSEVGVFSAVIDDLDDDGNLEMVTFSLVEDTRHNYTEYYLSLELFITEDGKIVPIDSYENIFTAFSGAGGKRICAFKDGNFIRISSNSESYGGSSMHEEYFTFVVENKSLQMKDNYSSSEFYRYDSYEYKETVSGTVYQTKEEFDEAAKQTGHIIGHWHDVGTRDELNAADKSSFQGNHIFSYSINCQGDSSYTYGYIYDNTDLERELSALNG